MWIERCGGRWGRWRVVRGGMGGGYGVKGVW